MTRRTGYATILIMADGPESEDRMTTRPVRKKYSHIIADAHKTKKRKEAEKRVEIRAGRSNKQQLACLDAGGYVAKRERVRLKVRTL